MQSFVLLINEYTKNIYAYIRNKIILALADLVLSQTTNFFSRAIDPTMRRKFKSSRLVNIFSSSTLLASSFSVHMLILLVILVLHIEQNTLAYVRRYGEYSVLLHAVIISSCVMLLMKLGISNCSYLHVSIRYFSGKHSSEPFRSSFSLIEKCKNQWGNCWFVFNICM